MENHEYVLFFLRFLSHTVSCTLEKAVFLGNFIQVEHFLSQLPNKLDGIISQNSYSLPRAHQNGTLKCLLRWFHLCKLWATVVAISRELSGKGQRTGALTYRLCWNWESVTRGFLIIERKKALHFVNELIDVNQPIMLSGSQNKFII